MTEIESLMEAHSEDKAIRVLYAAYRAVLHEIRAQASWLRDMGVGADHEASCLESQARSLEQNFARQMRQRVGGKAA